MRTMDSSAATCEIFLTGSPFSTAAMILAHVFSQRWGFEGKCNMTVYGPCSLSPF